VVSSSSAAPTTVTTTTTVTTPSPPTKTTPDRYVTSARPTSPAMAQTTYNIPAKLASLYEPEASSNMQYMTNMAALNSQNVKFVPCLCPVAINAPERRMDELSLEDDQNEVRLEDVKT
jgi:hypothetical protein